MEKLSGEQTCLSIENTTHVHDAWYILVLPLLDLPWNFMCTVVDKKSFHNVPSFFFLTKLKNKKQQQKKTLLTLCYFGQSSFSILFLSVQTGFQSSFLFPQA